jgi:ABC-2 type transport system ATP-binding protein
MTKTLLATDKLTKRYGEFYANKDISLSLREGDIYGLIGRNGAGKTTFFKCALGLATPSSGTIHIVDSEEIGLLRARRNIGFMINSSFFPYLTPKQALTYLSKAKGIGDSAQIDELLKLVELFDVNKQFKAFSMGMKQRLGIAAALLGEPKIVVLDEPINGLDPQGIVDIRNVIKRMREEKGVTFIISSHILSELDLLATRFGFIDSGELVKEVSHSELHEQTKKALIVETNDIDATTKLLQEKLGINSINIQDGRLKIDGEIKNAKHISKLIVDAGQDLFSIYRQEITLEEYFINMIGERNA